MRLAWTEPAIADRIAIYDYIETENPRAAADLDDEFMRAADRLRSHPEIGRPGRIAGTRELVAHRRYFLVYEIAGDTVFILAVRHASRQWPPLAP